MAPRRRAHVLVVVAFAAGCASYSPRVRPDERPNPGLAYPYGRFFVKAGVGKKVSLGAYPSLGMVIACANGQQYTIKFVNQRDLIQVVPMWPSRCGLVRVFRTDENGIRRGGGDVDPAGVTINDFQPGRAYYLGDYFAKAGIEYSYWSDRPKRYRAWDMSPADGRYESTTADMKRQFPGLAALPTEDKHLVRQQPPTKPGAVVVNDADEPPLTPDRIARVAPFVKRTYASPAECGAACPTGQCLPFRDETGAAMTCIVRCNSDQDCPEGLACNCPGGAAAGCPAIVETPKDKLAKICLSTERGGQRR